MNENPTSPAVPQPSIRRLAAGRPPRTRANGKAGGGLLGGNGGGGATYSRRSSVSLSAGAVSHETDVVVIGSGVGGLSAAAMLSRHGDSVTVLESHYLPGGVAHAFDIDGYKFDAGPSLWAGMSEPGTNPLRQILDVLEEEVRKWDEGKVGRGGAHCQNLIQFDDDFIYWKEIGRACVAVKYIFR